MIRRKLVVRDNLVHVRLSQREREALHSLAKVKGLCVSAYVRELLAGQQLENQTSSNDKGNR